ncbi:hypothetical protein FACS189415_0010 [Bacteroidia bacterium]|nr:hypothetical protein FACS189426_14430 [Bacteroidia bacterium]GHU81537.1 hypothetical protein FACS189415_0010 [Bacteroidia bacterium]GHV70660.1 hypothetical protein FACS189420_2700 [Bacteroidia bacterium]
MKKILFLSIIGMIAVLTGCSDLLDVTPKTDFTDDNFWKSENDLKGACNRLYEQLSSGGHDTRGDDQFGKSANGTSAGSWTIPAESDDWKNPYKRIFTANNIIEKGANAPVDEKIRDKYLGEASFFRAYNYFDLVCKYGDVPLLLKVFTSTSDLGLKMGRTPREEVIQQCYADLQFAADHLPTRADVQGVTDEFTRRRVTRSSALGLIVRIGLHEGTMQKYHKLGNDTQWKAHLQKSIDAYTLLKTEGHALYADYQALFLDESNSTNKEVLFAKAYGPNGGSGAGYTNHSYSGDCEGSYAITRPMIDLYLYADGLPREKSPLAVSPETSFNNVFGYEADGVTALADGKGARDPRLSLSIWRINDPQDDAAAVVGGVNIGWILSGKGAYKPFDPQRPLGYQQKKAFAGSRWGASRDYTDRIIIRWGEMLIAYAEALYELNGSITDAQLDETLNALRQRVGFSAKLTNAFATANGLNLSEEIRRERTVELMAENLRYADIIRWKIAETVLPKAIVGAKFTADEAYNGTSQAGDSEFVKWLTNNQGIVDGVFVYDEPNVRLIEKADTRRFNVAKDYYYPVPTFEIAQSGGNIKQNPSW